MENFLKGVIKGFFKFILLALGFISSIAYFFGFRLSKGCANLTDSLWITVFFLAVGFLSLAGVINKGGFETASRFIKEVVSIFKPSEDGIFTKILENKIALLGIIVIILAMIFLVGCLVFKGKGVLDIVGTCKSQGKAIDSIK